MTDMQILKINDEQRTLYGWASVISKDGKPVVDMQGDVIEAHELEQAATEFMTDVRLAKLNHEGGQVGEVIHSLPLSADIAKAVGLSCDREGWIVGIKIHSDEVWAAIKSQDLRSLSIGATAIREAI